MFFYTHENFIIFLMLKKKNQMKIDVNNYFIINIFFYYVQFFLMFLFKSCWVGGKPTLHIFLKTQSDD